MLVYLMMSAPVDDVRNDVAMDSDEMVSAVYQKHVESRGAYVLRGSGPSQVTHDKEDGMHNIHATMYGEDDERKSDLIETSKYNIDPVYVGGDNVSLNALANDKTINPRIKCTILMLVWMDQS